MQFGFVDHLVDVVARQPRGFVGRTLCRKPIGRMAGYHHALKAAPLQVRDRILDVACGGGAFIQMALHSGCKAYAVDCSKDMVDETIRQNAKAVAEERLHVAIANVDDLPFVDDSFTKLFCFNAFFFFPDPAKAMCEMTRVLAPGGKLVILTASPRVERFARFTLGPVASRMRFDTPEQLSKWADEAGLIAGKTCDSKGGNILLVAKKPCATAN